MKYLFLLLILVLTLTPGWSSEKVAVVNFSLIVSMHPEMALFDFVKLGFVKLPLGLSRDEWNMRLKKLKVLSQDKERLLRKDRIVLQNELHTIELSKRRILNSSEMSSLTSTKLLSELKKIAKRGDAIRMKIKEIDYQITCPELTSLAETRQRLDAIEKETMLIVKSVAREGLFTMVLNNSIPASYGFPVKYEASEMFGVGLPGMDRDLLYAFIANADHELASDENPESLKLTYWLELTSFPNCQNYLPVRPYPLVLSGGTSIDAKVISRLYAKYNINKKSIIAACSVIDTVNKRKATYQTTAPLFGKGSK